MLESLVRSAPEYEFPRRDRSIVGLIHEAGPNVPACVVGLITMNDLPVSFLVRGTPRNGPRASGGIHPASLILCFLFWPAGPPAPFRGPRGGWPAAPRAS